MQVTLMDQFVWGTSGQPFNPGQMLYVWIEAMDVNLLQVCVCMGGTARVPGVKLL